MHALVRTAQTLHPLGLQPDNLAGTKVIHGLVIQIGKCRRLPGYGIRSFFLSDYDRRAPPTVSCGYNAIFRQQQQGTRPFDFLIHVFDAFHKSLSLVNKQSYQFRRINLTRTELREMHALLQKLCGQVFRIIDFRYRHDRKTPQMRIHQQRLCIRITDDTDTGIPFKLP